MTNNINNKHFILFGGDYNPDQWDTETIEKDMKLFHQSGVNTVTLPVFSWPKLEPKENHYDFEWLDNILTKLHENNINVILATPTSAQPAWLSLKYPEVLPVDKAGRKRTHGMRVFFCVNSPKYRERAGALANKMAEHYKNHPAIIGWHVANEYGTFCYCKNCQNKFREWLKSRYNNLDTINEKWNTSFWGRTLTSFDEIMLPTELNDDYRFNPCVQLDYMRFVTDSTIDCYNSEAKILKTATPHLPVFTNISGFIKNINQFKMVPHMDYAGWDNYPSPTDERSLPALKHDIMRASKDGQSFYVAEQSPNQQNWQPYNKLKKPKEVRKIAFQGLSHGSDSSLFFQLRQSVAGQEKFHGAFISHNGRSDTRIFKEISELGEEFKKLDNTFQNGKTKSKVGILFDWENWWALELTSGPTKDMDYLKEVHHYYKALYYQNISVDILKYSSDVSEYKVIIAPLLYMLHSDVADKLKEWTKNGGTLITTYMSGYVDENDRCIYGAYPGPLKDVFGIWVEETDALYPDEKNIINIDSKKYNKNFYSSSFLCDLIHCDTATPLGKYTKDFYNGYPAITKNDFGKGKAYYLATKFEDEFLKEFFENICKDVYVMPTFKTSKNVEVTYRKNENGKFIFVINHVNEIESCNLGNDSYIDCLTNGKYSGVIPLTPYRVLILKKQCLREKKTVKYTNYKKNN